MFMAEKWTTRSIRKCQLMYSSEDTSKGTVGGSAQGAYPRNSIVTIEATPSTGWKFSGWYSGDILVSTEASYTFAITTDLTLVAKFAVEQIVYFRDYSTWNQEYYSAYAMIPDDGNVSTTPIIPGRKLCSTMKWYADSSSGTSNAGSYRYTINGTEQTKQEAEDAGQTLNIYNKYTTSIIPIPENCTKVRILTGGFSDGVRLDISLCYME